MKHTLWFSEQTSLTYKPVNLKPLTVERPAEGPHVLTPERPHEPPMQKRTFQIYRYDPTRTPSRTCRPRGRTRRHTSACCSTR